MLQTDLYGLAGTLNCMLFGTYMKPYYEGGRWKIACKTKRYVNVYVASVLLCYCKCTMLMKDGKLCIKQYALKSEVTFLYACTVRRFR